jgi:hypothetical protein
VKDTAAFKAIGTVTFMNSGNAERGVLELLRSGNNWQSLLALLRHKYSVRLELHHPAGVIERPPSFSMKLFTLARPRSDSVDREICRGIPG